MNPVDRMLYEQGLMKGWKTGFAAGVLVLLGLMSLIAVLTGWPK